MGVGKTTFARALLAGLGLVQPPEGSPTFAIAHEYSTPQGEVAHVDFYRLNSELEIEEAGIPAYLWERNLIVITEWLSSWPGFEDQVYQSDRIFEVLLEHVREVDDVPLEDVRQIKIFLHARR
jgi:tRNA threonylcarbamoyladenosine biosynthesis protein TsaE